MSVVMYEVANHGNTEYEEVFKGKKIRIPANGSIQMPKADANQFLAQMAVNEKGRLVPKMLSSKRISPEGANEMICNFCGKDDFKNRDEFLIHINTHAKDKYKDEALDKRLEESDKPFKCPFCNFRCGNEYSMKRHIETQHFQKRKGVKGENSDGPDSDTDLQPGKGASGRK